MRALSLSTSAKLFATGCTVGPIVDSLHNQCLLEYDTLPISLTWPGTANDGITTMMTGVSSVHPLFCSSWIVPPLLGVAYVVLGGILPRLCETIMTRMVGVDDDDDDGGGGGGGAADHPNDQGVPLSPGYLRQRALLAVITTAMIIKLSEVLETQPEHILLGAEDPHTSLSTLLLAYPVVTLLAAAFSQWAWLDATLPALMAASVTSLGGPLSELPFVAHGGWHYLESAGDYLPLLQGGMVDDDSSDNPVLQALLGTNYQQLALSSITGPCYFAVTMDAIALGRWFDATYTTTTSSSSISSSSSSSSSTSNNDNPTEDGRL